SNGLYSLITLDCNDYIGGNTYFIQVDGWGGSQGDFGIEVRTADIVGCDDPGAINYNPCATANDGSCEYPISGCGPDTYTYCYGNGEDPRFYYEAASGTDLYVQLYGGEVEGGWDDFYVWDNYEGAGTPLYTVSGTL